MKFTAILVAVVAAIAGVNAAAESAEATSLHIRIHVHEKHDKQAICYKACPPGQHCARGTTTCRGPKPNSTECFNPATAFWIQKCDAGFKCSGGKCVYAHKASKANAGNPNGAICYKACPQGQHCARGTTECRAPTTSTECFNPATSLWIPKCDAGFKCNQGKCVYAHKAHKVSKAYQGNPNGAICYKACPEGQHCARGTTECRAPSTSSECFNPATSLWIPKCDAGFKCNQGKCVYAHKAHKVSKAYQGNPNGAICYKACPQGQHCARGTTECRAPTKHTSECFNPATSLWINKCDAGFKCNQGKCVYA